MNIDGQTYLSSGIYTSISINAVRCTHVDTLNLIMGNSSSNSFSVSACDSLYMECKWTDLLY